VTKRTSPESLLDTYHAERHPVAAPCLRNTMAQIALRRTDDRTKALGDIVSELLGMDEPRRRLGAEMSGLDIHLRTRRGGTRGSDAACRPGHRQRPAPVFTLLHEARPVLFNLGEPGGFEITPWADRVQLIEPNTWVRGSFRRSGRSRPDERERVIVQHTELR
jgi:3-(3-hydroxy-phenyl)propionate hydroxylase